MAYNLYFLLYGREDTLNIRNEPEFSHLTLAALGTDVSCLSPLTKKAPKAQEGEGPVEAHRVEAKVKFHLLCGNSM